MLRAPSGKIDEGVRGVRLPEGCFLCRAGLSAARHKKESSAPSASLWCIFKMKGRQVMTAFDGARLAGPQKGASPKGGPPSIVVP